MKIKLVSVIVQDQSKALKFYTEVLGFVKRMDIPAGEYRWLTVVSPDEPDGTQVSLEPNANPVAATYQQALFESGIPLTAFESSDIQAEYERLKRLGVVFKAPPVDAGGYKHAIFEDTCGNLIQMYQVG